MTTNTISIRLPVVAGMFYSDDSSILTNEIQEYLVRAKPQKISGRIYGVVVPHAGYMYSGQTAAFAYKALQQQISDTYLLIGPSHREMFDKISVCASSSFRTPLGDYPINDTLRKKILDSSEQVLMSTIGHRAEHSLEVQVPFLQTIAPKASFVPLSMGVQTRELCSELADALTVVCKNESVVCIASSDLSHYHPHNEAVKIDSKLIEYIKMFDVEQWFRAFERGEFEACGAGPIGVVMSVSRNLGATHAEIFSYTTSGDVSGDMSAVVGYLAAAFVGA